MSVYNTFQKQVFQTKKNKCTIWAPAINQRTADAENFKKATRYSTTRFLLMKHSKLDLACVWIVKRRAILDALLYYIVSVLNLGDGEVFKLWIPATGERFLATGAD